MDSPSPHNERTRLNEDDESDNTLASVWNSFEPLHKFLSVLVVSLVFAALVFSSLPLWRPMGALMLHKLWDVLRFLVLTTSIGLGILNSRLWRRTHTEADAIASSSGKEDSFSSKVPFAGVFYGEAQLSYSFSDKETEASESERDIVGPGTDAATLTDREHCDRENNARLKGGHDARAATLTTDGHHASLTDREHNARLKGGHDSRAATLTTDVHQASLRENEDHQPYTQPATALAVSTRRGIAHERNGIRANHDKEDGAANEEVSFNPSIQMRHNTANVVSRGKNRLVKPYDDLGLAAVAQQPKQSSSSKIIHRRGSSLEFPIVQQGSGAASILENCAATVNHQSTPQAKVLSSEKVASSTDVKMAVHLTRKGTEPSGSSLAVRRVEHSNIEAGIAGAASKHSRSQSAYNLNELLVQHRPRSKPSTSGQFSKRRNVSLSCDIDKEYTNRGMPGWLSSVPSPPEPPFIHGYNIVENRVMSTNVTESKQDESSLRKAFTESLAPWRAVTDTVPVNIPTYTHKEATQSNKDPLTKTVEKQMENYPSGSPSTANTMGSPSPGELNKKVDAFIGRFHEQMRLQRLESLERSKQRR